MSNVIAGRITAPAHAGGTGRVGAFRFGEKFLCVGFVILTPLDAEFAISKIWFPSVKADSTIKGAGRDKS
jgi:hypothetical protein